jgi:hypothetical protein
MASIIHYSSFAVIPIVVLSKIKINKYLRILFIVVIPLFLIFSGFVHAIINIFFVQISHRLLQYAFLLTPKVPTASGATTLLINALIPLLILFNEKKLINKPNGNFVLNINAIYLIVLISTFCIPAFARFYTALVFIPLFSIQILYDANNKAKTINHFILFLSFVAIFFRTISYNVFGQSFGINPYKSILSK